MTDKDLTGRWTGEYIYGDVYKTPIKGTRVAFEIELTATGGTLKGSCVDDEFKTHFKDPATIEGTVKENTIHFIKRYPCLFSIDEDGRIILFPKLPSHEIHYSGFFENGRFSGNWKVTNPYADADEEESTFDYGREGFWEMQKG